MLERDRPVSCKATRTPSTSVLWPIKPCAQGTTRFTAPVAWALFMATDYATSPVTLKGQLLYGAGCGAITVLIRYFGSNAEGVSYAILLMNLCAWAIDKGFHRHQFGVSKEDIAEEKAAKKAEKKAAKEAAK